MNHLESTLDHEVVDVRHHSATSSIVIVCEHASPHIPVALDNLGVVESARKSHVAWDPGALSVAEAMAARLKATLVTAKISRLVYDCNRPPDALDAMPARSEVVEVPGNLNLSAAQKTQRVAAYYDPFRAAVAQTIAEQTDPVLITVHSFTPIYDGERREVEIGVLHDTDARLADAILDAADTSLIVRRNEPYGPADGVTHTLKEHALPGGHLNVMLEVRNDLISEDATQLRMADTLSTWVTRALAALQVAPC